MEDKNKKIKVLFCPSDNNPYSGAFLSMAALCKILKEDFNIEPYIILPYGGQGSELLREYGLRHELIWSEDWIIHANEDYKGVFRKFKKTIKNLKAFYKIYKIIKKENIDIVHLNTIWCYIGAICAIFSSTPFVWHIREAIGSSEAVKFFVGDIVFYLINRANKIICISNAVLDKYPKINKKRATVIYNGVDENKYYKKREIFQNENMKFICVGALQYKKGQIELIKAMKLLKDKGILNWSLDIYGKNGDCEHVLLDLIREYDLSQYVFLKGAKSDVEKYMKEADISFLPSHYEGFGRTAVESMMAGCLFIGSNSGALGEIIKDKETGLLHEVQDEKDIYDKIIYALEHKKECQKIALSGQKEALEKYSAKKNAKEIYNLYTDIMKW